MLKRKLLNFNPHLIMERKLLSTVLNYLFILTIGTVSAFNLDTESSVVYEGPFQSELFGYSVATHSYDGKQWLLVGAPLSNVTPSFRSEPLVKYGTVFKCEYKPGSKECTEIVVDNQPINTEQLSLPNGSIDVSTEKKTDQWLGATLYSTGKDGSVVTCAPRYTYARPTDDETVIDYQYLSIIGRCFQLRRDLQGVQGPVVSPCEGKVGYPNGNCQAGISAEYSADGHDLLMGIVGINGWRGGIVTYSRVQKESIFSPDVSLGKESYMGYAISSGHFLSPRTTEFVGGAPRDNDMYGKVLMYSMENSAIKVTSEISRPEGMTVGSYFGSTLCVVDLNSDMYSDLLVGAPLAHNWDEGRVFVYVNNRKGALNLQDSVGLMGDNVPFAQFGKAIARVGDLNKDSFQDVAIGAPFEGEDGSGTVYIYHGSHGGINPNYKQKIRGSSVEPGLKLFGSAIAGTVDMDGNDYPDIAVGAYGSNKAVLLRTRPVVNIEGKIRLSRNQIIIESNDSSCRLNDGQDHKCLNLSVCFVSKDNARQLQTGLEITYTIDLDRIKAESGSNLFRRMFFVDEVTKNKVFSISSIHNLTKQGESHCSAPRTVYLKGKDKLADVASSLSFDLSFGLVKPCGSDLCPVLNDSVQATHSTKAFFIKRCKNRQVCVPDLAVDGKVVLVGYDRSQTNTQQLRIGVVKELVLQLTISNKASDYAYYSKLLVKYPRSLAYQRTGDCKDDFNSENDTQSDLSLSCDVGRIALRGVSNEIFNLKFSAASVEEDFTIIVKAESQDADGNEEDNSKEFFVAVKYEADLEVKGYSKPDQVIYSGSVKEKKEVEEFQVEEIGPEIVQTIKVTNYGPSVVDGSQLTLTVPKLLNKDDPESFLIYLLQVEVVGPGSCHAHVNPLNIESAKVNISVNTNNDKRDRRDVTSLDCSQAVCQSLQCSLGRLRQGEKVEIKLTSRLWQNTLLKLNEPVTVELETIAKVRPPSKVMQPDEENDVTTIILTAKPERRGDRSKSIPWWVYLVSALGGFLLLAGAILLLYKLGFFKRNKEEFNISAEEAAPMNKV